MKPKVYLSQLTPKQMLQWYSAELENFKLAQQAELSRMDRILSVRLSNALEKRGLPSVSCYDDMNDLINRMFPDDRPQQIANAESAQPSVPVQPKQQPAKPEPTVTVDLTARDRYDKDAPEIFRLIKFIHENTLSYDDYITNSEVAYNCFTLRMLTQKHDPALLSQMLGQYSGYYETCEYIAKNLPAIQKSASVYTNELQHRQIVAERQQEQAAHDAEQAHQAQQQSQQSQQSARNAALLAGAQQALAKRNACQQPAAPVPQTAQPQSQYGPMTEQQAKDLLAQLG